jgi:predicted MFS family arabinose efflux permease
VSVAPAAGLRGAWTHRDWRWLLTANTLAGTANTFYEVVLAAWLLDRTGSAGWLAAGEACRVLPILAFGPLAGVAVDRSDRRRLLGALGSLQAGALLLMAVLVARDADPALVLATVLVSAALYSPCPPAVAASTPFLVDEASLAGANAAIGSATEITFAVGPALGALVLVTTSSSVAFVVAGVIFGASALAVVPIRSSTGGRRYADVGAASDRARTSFGYRAQLREGLAALGGNAALLVVTSLVVATFVTFGFERVLHVLVADQRLGIGAQGVGLLAAGLGAGALLAVPFSARVGDSRHAGRLLAVAAALSGLALVLLAVIRSPVVAVLVMLLEGAGNLMFEVLVLTLIQRLTPAPLLGRVFGLQDSVRAAAQLLGSLAAPLLLALAGLEATLAIAGGALVVYCAVSLPALQRAGQRADVRRLALEPVVTALAPLALFEGASIAALEYVAAAAVEETAAPGAVVVRQGDPPDDLYVIRTGRFSVTVDGNEVNRLGASDWFGELGIVRREPRSASVIATTAATLWRIPGAVFLDAIEGLQIAPEAGSLTATSRLQRTETADS